jgi:hypothetical protein
MEDTARWIWSGFTGLMAILGLFVAAGATNPVGYWGGIGFFVFAVLFILYQVKLAFDHAEAHGQP